MQINEERIGDVVVLSLRGKMTLGEGDELLKDKVNSLIQRKDMQIVLHLGGVPYIDSAGLGEIVRTYTTVSRQGGRLVLCDVTKRIEDLLSIEKLLYLFDTYSRIEDAVAGFTSASIDVLCPVCRPPHWCTLRGPAHSRRLPTLFCGACLTSAALSFQQPNLEALVIDTSCNGVAVTSLSFPTYSEERVHVQLGVPCTITIEGRLDIFAWEVVEKAWRVIPTPRRVVFPLDYRTRSATAPALAKLLELCGHWTDESRTVIQVTQWTIPDIRRALPRSARVLGESYQPEPELCDVKERPSITATVRRHSSDSA
jgi:anti-sigma B factor antagonist